jgi:hypothetical protein
MDESRPDDESVGPAVVCPYGNDLAEFRCYLSMGQRQEFEAELWAIGVALQKSGVKAEALQAHGVSTLAFCSDSQAAIRWTAHLDPGPEQQVARAIS